MTIKYTYDNEGDSLSITFSPGEKGIGIELNDYIPPLAEPVPVTTIQRPTSLTP